MASFISLHILGIYLSILCVVAFIGTGLFVCLIWAQEKHKIEKAPKIPYSMCDEHGPYPSSLSLWIDVPGVEGQKDLRVELCPLCYKKRMQESLKTQIG